MKRICVYCGSLAGGNPAFGAATRRLGQLLARRQITLVYGGGNVGLMGILADAVLGANGQAIGVIPQFFIDRGLLHSGLTDVRITRSMHERKTLMFELADAFVALPGGFGTLEELMEILTWAQLGMHGKRIGALNVDGFFDPLLALMAHLQQQQFLRSSHDQGLLVETDEQRLLDQLEN